MDEEEFLIINQVMGDLLEAEEGAGGPVRHIQNIVNPFNSLSDEQFRRFFRIGKVLAQELITLVRPFVFQGQSYSALDLQTKVKTSLFYDKAKEILLGVGCIIILCPWKLPENYWQ